MLNLIFHFVNLGLQLAVGVVEDDGGDDASGYSAGSAEVCLLGNVDVRNILVFTEEWEVEHDLEGRRVGGQND